MNHSIIDYALSYAKQGWYVIPLHSIVNGKCTCTRKCKSPGKHPRFSKWQDKATTDPEIIKQFWIKYPDANIGILTGKKSGLVVIDIDPRNNGDKSLNDLIETYPDFKSMLDTYTISTGGNGTHYYYTYSSAFKSFKKHGLGEGIDIKADGGYILAPPSNHKSGGIYQVANDTEAIRLPQMLIGLITPHAPEGTQKAVTEGNRNNWLAEQAGAQLRQGKSLRQVETYLLEQNALNCSPQLDHDEVLGIARSMSASFSPTTGSKSFKTEWQDKILRSGQGAGFSHALLGLSSYMNADGRNCYPTQELLENEFKVTRKTLQKHFDKAEELGYLQRYRHSSKGKSGFNHGYMAKIPD